MRKVQITASIRRTDYPDDPPDAINEAATGWTPDLLAVMLRERYGPTVLAEIAIDNQRWLITGDMARFLGAGCSP